MKRNVLIVLEGISGSGKSSILAELLESLNGQNYEVVYFKWNQVAGIKKILSYIQFRQIICPSIYALLEWLSFFIGYRRIGMRRKRENLVIICDRYLYTGITRERTNHAAIRIGSLFLKFCRVPDLIIFMDTAPEICLERIRKRGKRLFCPNKRLLKELGAEVELEYLKKSRNEYESLFSQIKMKNKALVHKISSRKDRDELKQTLLNTILKKGE